MRIILMTPVRLFGEGLALCLDGKDGIVVDRLVTEFGALRDALGPSISLALIDVTAGFEIEEVRAIAVNHPAVKLVAMGIRESNDQVVLCGQAGFTAYVSRHAPLETLCDCLLAAAAGRLAMPDDIACGLMRALFRFGGVSHAPAQNDNTITKREGDVLRLLGRGFSNKEIARELDLSVATVKHHVHSILGKLGVARRTQAMRRVREAPWIA
ncbi:DNA-binding NarL/FixJ family response regulator [Bradyrhizobium japonicum]|uniref:helix-turn-helix transcriptional regulator n=1 Tax=Bradyrhizobium japonicum TaxID=375 RepID=UPI0021676170|nr:response regulator transcription factor [Bradyrhizobium japonicum]MCS3499349.1 DNA-binding NarL/FixJ family response regulator [Bradyrhizobium japonicum]MCS3958487.1 DNA-binding NarL/FixJ family response regulator [Bradyrhizobium japonicum]MCS4000241.1 DNA-binding NarL/FixJ family response regulator [Bradyrhizobium japonicum]